MPYAPWFSSVRGRVYAAVLRGRRDNEARAFAYTSLVARELVVVSSALAVNPVANFFPGGVQVSGPQSVPCASGDKSWVPARDLVINGARHAFWRFSVQRLLN